MSKRITLTDLEIEQIAKGLRNLRDACGLQYEVINVGKHFYNQIISKLESQHPRSVETLGVSGNGDKSSIAESGPN